MSMLEWMMSLYEVGAPPASSGVGPGGMSMSEEGRLRGESGRRCTVYPMDMCLVVTES